MGSAIGEDELLQEDPVYGVTAISNESVELMEIARDDFDRILKEDRSSERGRLLSFVQELPFLDGQEQFGYPRLAGLPYTLVVPAVFLPNTPDLLIR